MTDELACAEVQDQAPDFVLGLAEGNRHECMRQHLEGCERCRREVDRLRLVMDRLLLLGPVEEPPPDFHRRVAARLAAEMRPSLSPPRPKWRAMAVAAAVILLVGAASLLAALVHPQGERSAATVASLVTVDGQAAGQVVLSRSRPVRMTCTVETSGLEGSYGIEVTLADGSVQRLADFSESYVTMTWSTQLDVPVEDVRQVKVRGGDGVVRSVARFGA